MTTEKTIRQWFESVADPADRNMIIHVAESYKEISMDELKKSFVDAINAFDWFYGRAVSQDFSELIARAKKNQIPLIPEKEGTESVNQKSDDKLDAEFRSILSHAITTDVIREEFDLAVNGCVEYAKKLMKGPEEKPLHKIPYRCPFCGGTMTVHAGFYSGGYLGTSASPEPCRSCSGTGIIWGE